MNIVTKTINHLEYGKHRRLRNKSLKKANECLLRGDDEGFKYWSIVNLNSVKRCIEIPFN